MSNLREYSSPQFCHYKNQTQHIENDKLIKVNHVRTLAYTVTYTPDTEPGTSWDVSYGAAIYKSEPGVDPTPWVRKHHSLLAVTRLQNAPIRFNLKGFGDSPGYYQFRRLEQHILDMLHTNGVCSCEKKACKCLETVSAMIMTAKKEKVRVKKTVTKKGVDGFKVLDDEKKKKQPVEIFEPSLTFKEKMELKQFQMRKEYENSCQMAYNECLNNFSYRAIESRVDQSPPVGLVFVYAILMVVVAKILSF